MHSTYSYEHSCTEQAIVDSCRARYCLVLLFYFWTVLRHAASVETLAETNPRPFQFGEGTAITCFGVSKGRYGLSAYSSAQRHLGAP